MLNIKHFGEVNKKGKYYYIEVNGEEKKLLIGELETLLNNNGFTLQDYYNISVYGDINYSNKCLMCDKPTTLKHRMYKGYNKFCSMSCSTSYRNINVFNPSKSIEARQKISTSQSKRLKELSFKGLNPFQNKEFIAENALRSSERQKKLIENGEHAWQTDKYKKEHSERLSNRNISLSIQGKHNFQNPFITRKSLISRYEKLGVTHTHLYLILQDSNNVKVGTSYNLHKRKNEVGNSYGNIGEIHSIFYGDIFTITEIEAIIKEKYCNNNSELFDYIKLKNVLNEVRLFKINSVQRLSKS